MKIYIDDSELRTLEADFAGADRRIQRNLPAVMRGKIGPALARQMRRDAGGHRYLPHLPSSVSWEMLDQWTVEAGLSPKPGTQGALAHIIVYGSVNNGPVYDHTAGPRRLLPRWTEMLGDAAEDSVLGGRG